MALNLKIVLLVSTMIAGTVSHQRVSPLNGKHLIIASGSQPPFIFFKAETTTRLADMTTLKGLIPEMLWWIAARHNFTFTLYNPPAPDNSFGFQLANGSWNGIMGQIIRGERAFSALHNTVIYGRSKYIDYSFPFMQEDTAILIPYPQIDDSFLTAVGKPYTVEVWILIIVSLLIVASLLSYLHYKGNGRSSEPGLFVIRLYGILVNQGSETRTSSPSSVWLVCVWCLTAVVIVNVYTSTLTSFMTIPKLRPLVSSIEELAKKPDIQPLVYRTSALEASIKESKSGPLKAIGDSLLKNPSASLVNFNFTDLVRTGKYVMLFKKSVLAETVVSTFQDSGECQFTLAKEVFNHIQLAFIFPKNSPLTGIVSMDIMRMIETGLIQHWQKHTWPDTQHCTAKIKEKPKISAIKLRNLSGAFLVLIIGVALSAVVFILEVIAKRFAGKVTPRRGESKSEED